jgi:hypothetical protein
MTRIQQRDLKRKLVHLEQEGSCLICDYPLILGCHLHDVIANDDKGPDHPLNLVGLCANHHAILECVRRHVAPKETRGSSSWLQRGQAALKIVEALPDQGRHPFNELAEPHPLRKELREGVEPRRRTALAADIAHADARLLVEINKARPGIVLLWRIRRGEASEPKTEADWTKATEAVRETLRLADFGEVVMLHLFALGLPFEPAWLRHETAPETAS